MEAKDLRIGNITSAGVVSEILQDRFYVHDGESSLKSTWFDIKPAPLTEEWLLKFGFEWEDVESKTNGETDKMLFKDILLMKRHHNDLWAACPYGYLISPHRTLYVHQLQNLYFALTGEELTIKK